MDYLLQRYFLLATLSIFITFSGIAQNSALLPDNLTLSSNGKFVNNADKNGYDAVSDNGVFKAKYDIGQVSDELREIKNFRLFKNEELLYTLKTLPGSDVYISNSGYVAAMDMQLHFQQQLTINLLNSQGDKQFQHAFKYASLFGFSPLGNYFVVGTDKQLQVFSTENNTTWELERSSQFAFSEDESFLATAFEDNLYIYNNFEKKNSFNTGLMYPRNVAVLPNNNVVTVIGKQKLKIYNLISNSQVNELGLEENLSYRDLEIYNDKILVGIQYKKDGILNGILKVINPEGQVTANEVLAEKQYKTFEDSKKPIKSTTAYDPIPWPFEPFNEIHKVWNHYEQHMGNGSGDYSYLHQGLDIEVPDNEPTYAVAEGWVKLVLTLGGDVYWRTAISPEQVSGYSDGWLYAHLVESSIAVDVGDYVEIHEYVGDIIHWAEDWGHIHFVNIHDQGDVWYYNDDEWGINFNPLLAITPLGDNVAPVIEEFSSDSKFGYCENETSNYLSPDNLYGEIDIIAKISDYHAESEWEQPAYRTYYWITNPSTNDTLITKTLGQILNHPYEMYNGGYYEPYAFCLYKKDNTHPSPPWMNWDRDYWQILTNNNGDSIVDPSETELALITPDFADGNYRIFIEAWDEAGNMAIDSQDVVFANYVDEQEILDNNSISMTCYPNPAREYTVIDFGQMETNNCTLLIQDIKGRILIEKLLTKDQKNITVNTNSWEAGIYFVSIKAKGQMIESRKIMILE